jgi:hypothetical protein
MECLADRLRIPGIAAGSRAPLSSDTDKNRRLPLRAGIPINYCELLCAAKDSLMASCRIAERKTLSANSGLCRSVPVYGARINSTMRPSSSLES